MQCLEWWWQWRVDGRHDRVGVGPGSMDVRVWQSLAVAPAGMQLGQAIVGDSRR
jgi:hypothetical protein